jgi:hypothetical protein
MTFQTHKYKLSKSAFAGASGWWLNNYTLTSALINCVPWSFSNDDQLNDGKMLSRARFINKQNNSSHFPSYYARLFCGQARSHTSSWRSVAFFFLLYYLHQFFIKRKPSIVIQVRQEKQLISLTPTFHHVTHDEAPYNQPIYANHRHEESWAFKVQQGP